MSEAVDVPPFEIVRAETSGHHVVLTQLVRFEADDSLAICKTLELPVDDPSVIESVHSMYVQNYAINHPNVHSLFSYRTLGQAVQVFLPYFDYLSLEELSETTAGQHIPEEVLCSIFSQVLSGLNCLLENRRFHRDIRPQSILLHSDGTVALTNLEFSKTFDDLHNQLTPIEKMMGEASGLRTFTPPSRYMAPERIEPGIAQRTSDVWSAAACIWSLACNRPPYAELPESMYWYEIPRLGIDATEVTYSDYSEDFAELLSKCFESEPERRKHPFELLNDPFLTPYTGENAKTIVSEFLSQIPQPPVF
eukprot:TRINITY_DN17343_c0_g1_i1.p1 TRINITY_DN17343_c0_g1~~TRINITY_DN17343_c0_g1_i1.p1  ORF type:complete len:329 (+),score=61.14 TRINITY_DN17343_c0_g1_i1:69-989(+)